MQSAVHEYVCETPKALGERIEELSVCVRMIDYCTSNEEWCKGTAKALLLSGLPDCKDSIEYLHRAIIHTLGHPESTPSRACSLLMWRDKLRDAELLIRRCEIRLQVEEKGATVEEEDQEKD